MCLLNKVGLVDKLQIVTLMDDYSGRGTHFIAQHGISFLLRIYKEDMIRNILFDTGQSSEAIINNMELLGIAPKCIDMIYLSHCHWDHTKGLTGILKEINKDIPIIAHPDIFRLNYKFNPDLNQIGITAENSKEVIEKNGGQLVLVDKPFEIMPGVVSTGEIERVTSFENTEIGSYNLKNGELFLDQILDDMSIIINVKDKGIVIVTGCSHAGIINIIKHSIKIAGVKNVWGVIGGLHLVDSSEEQISLVASELSKLNIERIVAGHCTGLPALCTLLTKLGNKFSHLHVGKIIEA